MGDFLIKSQKIKKVREALGLSVADFARKCGYSGTAIIRAEKSGYKVTDEVCEKICDIFGVNKDWLMDDSIDIDGLPIKNSNNARRHSELGANKVPIFTACRYGSRFLTIREEDVTRQTQDIQQRNQAHQDG